MIKALITKGLMDILTLCKFKSIVSGKVLPRSLMI